MATYIWVNIGSGNGLLPNGTKPLPEPSLTCHQYGSVACFTAIDQVDILYSELENYNFKITATPQRGQWVKSIYMNN